MTENRIKYGPDFYDSNYIHRIGASVKANMHTDPSVHKRAEIEFGLLEPDFEQNNIWRWVLVPVKVKPLISKFSLRLNVVLSYS